MTDINTHTLTEQPLVSVVIPIYNRKKTLKKAVLSVVNQNYKNIELLLIDDCSTDGSAQLCDHLAHQYHIIRVIHQPKNGGVEQARYDSIKACKGKYLTFIDSDDWLEKDIINHCIQVAEREKVDAVHFNFYRTIDKYGLIKKKRPVSTISGRVEKDEIMQQIYPLYFGKQNIFTSVCGFVYHRDVFNRTDISPVSLPVLEDQGLNMRLMPYINSMYITNKYGYYYRYGGRTSKYSPQALNSLKQLYALQCKCIEQFQVDKEAYDYIAYELKNNFLHHIEELISLGETKEKLISFIETELQQPIYDHLFKVYATRTDLTGLNLAVKERNAYQIYELSKKVSKQHQQRRRIAQFFQFFLRFLP